MRRKAAKTSVETIFGQINLRRRPKESTTRPKPLGRDYLSGHTLTCLNYPKRSQFHLNMPLALRAPVKHNYAPKKIRTVAESGLAGKMASLYASGQHSSVAEMLDSALTVSGRRGPPFDPLSWA